MIPEFRPLPTISDLQKFVTPDEIRGAGVKQGFFRICDAVTSKINRAGHALYQLATKGKRSEQSNEKVIGELQGIVTDLKIACNHLKTKGNKLTAPEQVKAAIKYTKALEKKLRQIDHVLSHMPRGLNVETQAKLISLAGEIGTLARTNGALQEDLRSKIGKKIHPDSLVGIQKFVQAEGKFSPVLSRLRGLVTGKGWMDNPKVQQQLKTEFQSLQADIAKLPNALHRSETVAMVQRLEAIQGNAQIKLNTLKTIAESLYTEEGSPEKTAKETLLGNIKFQQDGLDNLKADLSSRKQLLATQTSLSKIADKLQSITPKGGYQEIKELKNLEQDINILKSLLEQNPISTKSSQVNFSNQVAKETQKVLITAFEKIRHSKSLTQDVSYNFTRDVATMKKDLESLEDQTPGIKLRGYTAIADASSAIMDALEEMDVPKTGQKAKPFSEARINAPKIYNEAVTKGEKARQDIVKIESELIQELHRDLEEVNQEIQKAIADGSFFTKTQDKIQEWSSEIKEIEEELSTITRSGFQKENKELIKNTHQQMAGLTNATLDLLVDGHNLITVSNQLSLLTEQFNGLMNNHEDTWEKNHLTGIHLKGELDQLLTSTKNKKGATDKNHPLYNRSQELIGRMENLKVHLEDHIGRLEKNEFKIDFLKTALDTVGRMIDDNRSRMDLILKDKDLLVDQKVDNLRLLEGQISVIKNTYTTALENVPKGKARQDFKEELARLVSELEKEISSEIATLSYEEAYMQAAREAFGTIQSFGEGIVSAVKDPGQNVWVFKEGFVSERGDRRREELLQAIDTLQNAHSQFKNSSLTREDELITQHLKHGKILLDRYDASVAAHNRKIEENVE